MGGQFTEFGAAILIVPLLTRRLFKKKKTPGLSKGHISALQYKPQCYYLQALSLPPLMLAYPRLLGKPPIAHQGVQAIAHTLHMLSPAMAELSSDSKTETGRKATSKSASGRKSNHPQHDLEDLQRRQKALEQQLLQDEKERAAEEANSVMPGLAPKTKMPMMILTSQGLCPLRELTSSMPALHLPRTSKRGIPLLVQLPLRTLHLHHMRNVPTHWTWRIYLRRSNI